MTREQVLEQALRLACERIADGPQQYHEANTPAGWFGVLCGAAEAGVTVEAYIFASLEQRPAE